jgi:hypothetical protein
MGDVFKFTGGCLCGAVRYECTEPPVSAGTCHCRECQQWTGSAYNAFVGFPTSALRFTKGKPKIFNAPSGIKELGFCSDCGSPLWDRYFVRFSEDEISGPHLVWMPIGTLDKPEAVTLKFHYGVETQLSWVHFDDDLPRMRCDEEKGLQEALEFAKLKNI